MDNAREGPDRARDVAGYYDRLADVYGEGAYSHARRAAVLAAIAAEIAGARAVLDLGCGNGAYAAEFVSRVPSARVVGADLSPAMLQAARRRMQKQLLAVRADATALPFRPDSFDCVFLSHVLLLVGDLERCVAEVASSLVPNGILVATVGTGGWRETLRPLLGSDNWQDVESLFAAGISAGADDEPRVTAACAKVGLRPQWRRATFSLAWPAVAEGIRIRWLTIADEAQRERAEQWLAEMATRTTGLTLQFGETLLIARKR